MFFRQTENGKEQHKIIVIFYEIVQFVRSFEGLEKERRHGQCALLSQESIQHFYAVPVLIRHFTSRGGDDMNVLKTSTKTTDASLPHLKACGYFPTL